MSKFTDTFLLSEDDIGGTLAGSQAEEALDLRAMLARSFAKDFR